MSKRSSEVLVLLLLVMVVSVTSLPASLGLFLDVDGIPGESTDKNHTNQVDVLAWSWGMSNSVSSPGGGGGGTGKINFQDLGFIKYVDKSSPQLMLHCANGQQIAKATLIVRKTGAIPIEYLKIELADVLVTSVSADDSGGEDRLTENVSLNFARVRLDYVATKPNGVPEQAISFNWDLPGNSGNVLSSVAGLSATLVYTNGAPLAKLTWSSTAGASYQVWAATEPDAAFQRYGGTTASVGDGTTSITVPADAIRKFFRIETLSAP